MKSSLIKSNFSSKLVSRLLGATSKNNGSCAISTPEIREMASRCRYFLAPAARSSGTKYPLPVDVASVSDLSQLYRSLVNKSEERSPVARNAEREKANERCGKALRVKQGVKRVFAQTLNKNHKLVLLWFWQLAGASLKLRMKCYVKHFANGAVRLGNSLRLRNAWWECDWRRAMPSARIQGDTHPRSLSRRCLLRTSGAFSLPFQVRAYSYRNDTPQKRKINERAFRACFPFYEGRAEAIV